MLCKLHSVYNTLHTLCDITQKVSNHYTVEGQFFAFNLEKNYTGQKIFTQTPSVASVTNIGYVHNLDILTPPATGIALEINGLGLEKGNMVKSS